MYTRFKNQKSGIKLGLNTITSTSRKVVVTPPSSASVSLSNSASSSCSTQSINSIDIKSAAVSPTSPTCLLSSVLASSTASVILLDDNNNNLREASSSCVSEQNKTQCTVSSLDNNLKTEIIPFQLKNDGTNLNKKRSNSNKKYNEKVKTTNEEILDPNGISYVKSMWEKYSSEIGTQDGPLRHVDENNQYPHLNGFVAFDMEHWWAERSISSMINEKSINSNETNNKKATIKSENDFILSAALNKSAINLKPTPASSKLIQNSIPSLQSLNSFQLCFS